LAKELTEGSKAPAFKLPSTGGGAASLKDYAGKALVLYFYPKDDTSGCTAEAIAFSELEKDFAKAGAAILGVSKDSLATHEKFQNKHKLKVALGSDEAGEAVEAYGVWVEKSMYGKKYMGIERSTFLIDGKGVIRRIWRKVKVPGHAAEVLAAVKAL
jgi:peroxiredoxin Q/BCP